MGGPPEHTWIRRPRLAGRVSTALRRGSVVLTAPAGYGKSTVLEESLALSRTTSAWVRCTAGSRDGGQLVMRLLAAVRTAVPGAADALAEILDTSRERVDAVAAATALVAELDRLLVDPLVVVFDDAEHLAGAGDAEAVVRTLLASSGRMLPVAVASRRRVELGGQARRGTAQLTAADLAFTPEECEAYLAQAMARPPTRDEVDALVSVTDGWPLAVTTLVVAGWWRSHHRLEPLRSPDTLQAFLAEEVLGALDDTTRGMVLDSAVPSVLTAATVEALGLPSGSIDDFWERGLFLQPVDEDAFAYHPLFRDVLLDRLAAERNDGEVADLHRRVAPAVAARGLAVEAVEHWLSARDWPAVTAAMAAGARTLANTSPVLVRGWVDRLPYEVRTTPVVQLLEGQLEWAAANYAAAVGLLRAAVAADGLAADPASAWWARFLLVDCLSVIGDLKGAVDVAAGFDQPAAGPAGVLSAATGLYAAHCLAALGRSDEAVRLAARAQRLPEKDFMAPVAIQLQAYIDVPAGHFDRALDGSLAALRLLEGSDPLLLRFNVMTTIALVLAEEGRLEEALEWWCRIAADASANLLTGKVRAAYGFQAMLLAQLGRLGEADAKLAAYEPVTTWVGWAYHIARAMVAAGRGDPVRALDAARDSFQVVSPAPPLYRIWTAVLLVPVLVRSGAGEWGRRVLAETTDLVDTTFPRDRGRFARARLRALRAWLAARQGDTRAAIAEVTHSVTEAGDAAAWLLRLEWERIEPLILEAVEDGLDPADVVEAVARAFPDGAALVRFTEQPNPALRRAAIIPALASGHPVAAATVARLQTDRDAEVAAAARDGLARAVAQPPPRVFSTLGGFGVRRGGWRIDERHWARAVDARVVRYLLVRRDRPVPEDDLFEAFWPDAPAERARRSLQVAVSRIRAVLDHPGDGASVVEHTPGAYRLRLGPADVVDSEQFEVAARAALTSPLPARQPLEHARSLWGGEPLPRERYADWATAWRQRLSERYLEVLAALVDCYGREGDHAAAIVAAREMVELDPLDESARRELMAAYARAGRRAQALREYLECRRALVGELGVEPAEATVRLQGAILAGEEV